MISNNSNNSPSKSVTRDGLPIEFVDYVRTYLLKLTYGAPILTEVRITPGFVSSIYSAYKPTLTFCLL